MARLASTSNDKDRGRETSEVLPLKCDLCTFYLHSTLESMLLFRSSRQRGPDPAAKSIDACVESTLGIRGAFCLEVSTARDENGVRGVALSAVCVWGRRRVQTAPKGVVPVGDADDGRGVVVWSLRMRP